MASKPRLLVLVSLLLLLRGRVITGPREIIQKLCQVSFRRNLSPSELAQALQQLYVQEPGGTRQLLVPFRNSISKVPIHTE